MPSAANKSIWTQTTVMPQCPPLTGDISSEAVVLGAGMAGVLIARRLQAMGMSVVVLDADRPGAGQTKNTTAKITSQHGMVYDALIKRFGEGKAAQYARANQAAVREYAALVRELNIDCDFEKAPAYLYSTEHAEPLEVEAEAQRKLGLNSRFTTETELPFAVKGAVRLDNQARFHPLMFLCAACEGLQIYGGTRALAVEDDVVTTERGSVRYRWLIFATHYPFVNVPGWYFMRMHQERSYVAAFSSKWLPRGMYYGTDADGLSLRTAEGLLLVGGENHRAGENSEGGRYERLIEQARGLFPEASLRAQWSAQDCMTLDGVPYIGRFSPSTPNWFVATGFGKWGMTSSMVASMLIPEMISGRKPDWGEVFDPSRLKLSASAKSLATDTAQAVKGLGRSFLSLPDETLRELPEGHGGIVEYSGHKVGVYKAPDGIAHMVTPRCPHLGCQLEWNPDELSWDCPCHGSRFDYAGTLLDDPAQTGIEAGAATREGGEDNVYG